ncbi:MAG TPA: DinB family protein [Thermoanaerobaculia bacterium]|nr:DinB family protein [Thermoanaerobaculia bacterium]
MTIGRAFVAELEQEAAVTRRLLERVPVEKGDWKPHEKSMTLGRLAGHVADLPGWAATMFTEDTDFASPEGQHEPFLPARVEELLARFDASVERFRQAAEAANDEQMRERWQLRQGEKVFLDLPRAAAVRGVGINHMIHHRGQLSVYLRLLDVPLPSIYGPTADEQVFG